LSGGIYDRYSPEIHAYDGGCWAITALAEDCTAETFTRLLSALRNGGGPAEHLRAYLYRTAHTGSRPLSPQAARRSAGRPADGEPGPEVQAVASHRRRQMRAALLQLTPEQRQVILLRFFQELDPSETALAVGRPLGAVKALQHRALAALQKRLVERGLE
jgi:RNA polymerase sigma-70 factor (ECF subfamily)